MSIPQPRSDVNWMLYGIGRCPYCKKARSILNGQPGFVYVDIEQYTTTEHFKDSFASITNNHRTVPMIFYQGRFFGGCQELEELARRS